MRHSRLRFAACAFAALRPRRLRAVRRRSAAAQGRRRPCADRSATDSAPIAPLLEMMSELPQGDPARQAELFQSAKDAAALTPTTSNRLTLCPGAGDTRP